MFTFFRKQKYLVDYLEGFVDMHNHILPGIDDGAKTVEDSIAMLNGLSGLGINSFIATPHIMHNYYPNTPETIGNAFGLLNAEILKRGLKQFKVTAAAEHMIDSEFETKMEAGKVMPMKGNYMLIEMSYLQPSINFDEAIQKIADHRFFPILAHPERYVYFKESSSKFKAFKESGILFQLNLLSLGQYYGKEVQRKAFKLIEGGYIDFIASDIHNLNQIGILREIKIDQKMVNTLVPIIQRTIYEFK